MKFTYTVIFLLGFSVLSYAQTSTDYVKAEIKKVENYLAKQNSKLHLTNIQKDKLVKIFEEKKLLHDQIIQRSEKLSKVQISNEMGRLENEYKDRIESIMDVEQRLAYQKIKKTPPISESKMN